MNVVYTFFSVQGLDVYDGPRGHVPLPPVQVRSGVHRRPCVRAERLLPSRQVLQLSQLDEAGADSPHGDAPGGMSEDYGVLSQSSRSEGR
jgi:hypothetical protein